MVTFGWTVGWSPNNRGGKAHGGIIILRDMAVRSKSNDDHQQQLKV